jgi:hypothetical protein
LLSHFESFRRALPRRGDSLAIFTRQNPTVPPVNRPSARPIRATVTSGLFLKLLSQILRTIQPLFRNRSFVLLSLRLFLCILFVQNSVLDFGETKVFGFPCQKSPSTKITTLSLEKTKSGLPGNFEPRLQPLIAAFRSKMMSRNSVDLFRFERTLLIISDRFSRGQISAIQQKRLSAGEYNQF